MRVLYVDDDREFVARTATVLEDEDGRFTVETVTTAREGLDRIAQDGYECIVSEFDLPDTTGLEFLTTVREQYPNLPFILFTGEDSEDIASEAISAGVTDYIQKEPDADRYDVLATRIENAVAQTEQLEAVTAQLEQQYEYLFEQAPVMAVVTRTDDGTPVIEDCNQRFVETVGYEKSDVVGRELAAFYTPESRTALLEEGGYARALTGDFAREDRQLVTADGEIVETLLRAVPRQDEPGEAIGTLAFYVDITERKQLKRENRRLEKFTTIVSHDLQNPLSVAQGQLELAQQECECDSGHLDVVMQALERMETLIADLLTLARSGTPIDDTEPVDLADVAETCWQTVETAEAALVIETSQRIQADRSRLQQLLENLVRNAVDHGGDGVTVTIGDLDDEPGFYVADDGPGIPPDHRETVTESGYSTSEDGIGFGLAIVTEIVAAHGWELTVTDSDDAGARFEITGVDTVA